MEISEMVKMSKKQNILGREVERLEDMLAKREQKVADAKRKLASARERAKAA